MDSKVLRVAFYVLLTVGVIALVGCRTAPVYNVEEAPVNVDVSNDDVKNAILGAGASLGWQMESVSSDHIVGTLILRKHMAKVDIKYDAKSYSISYKDSKELKYNGSNIHSNYNGWIQNLDNSIQARLSEM